MTTSIPVAPPFRLAEARFGRRPYPHIAQDGFLEADLYESLRTSFPECKPTTGPTGSSLYWGDPEYDRLVSEHPAWSTLFRAVQSQAFVDDCLARFRDIVDGGECLLDLSSARFVSYREDKVDKELQQLREVVHEPDELWVRMDIHQGHVGYLRRKHRDHKRRVISMLVYFCDAEENRMTGGGLVLHSERRRFLPRATRSVLPRHNRMVAFACARNSIHSVPEIRSQTAPRNFIQIAISSSVDAWG